MYKIQEIMQVRKGIDPKLRLRLFEIEDSSNSSMYDFALIDIANPTSRQSGVIFNMSIFTPPKNLKIHVQIKGIHP